MAVWIEPVTLDGEHVVLEPLTADHAEALADATADGELWKLWYTFVPSPDRVTAYIETALEGRARHGDLPFAVRHRESGRVIGSTRFFRADADNRRLELGHTWYARRFQRSAVNSECKLLLLGHAFERRGAAHPLAQPRLAQCHRPAGRQAGRRAAPSHGERRRYLPGHGGVFHSQPGVAGGAPESQPAAGPTLA